MRKRTVTLLIGALLFIGLVVGLWVMAPGEKLSLDLTFLGYTNEALATQTPAGSSMVFYRSLALVQASNSGNQRLELWNGVSGKNQLAEDFGRPLSYGFPRTLKPGQTGIVRVRPGRVPWRTEVGYRRRGARERILRPLWDVVGNTGRQWLSRMDLWPAYQWATCGPIASPITELPRVTSLTNYFLDLADPDAKRPFDIHHLLTNFPPQPSLKYEVSGK